MTVCKNTAASDNDQGSYFGELAQDHNRSAQNFCLALQGDDDATVFSSFSQFRPFPPRSSEPRSYRALSYAGSSLCFLIALRKCYLNPITNNGSDRMPIKAVAKFCSVAAIVLVVFAALGPSNWAPRTELGWEADHFLGWFVITSLVCFAWPRPFVVGGPSWPSPRYWRACKLLHRIVRPIFWLQSAAQAGR